MIAGSRIMNHSGWLMVHVMSGFCWTLLNICSTGTWFHHFPELDLRRPFHRFRALSFRRVRRWCQEATILCFQKHSEASPGYVTSKVSLLQPRWFEDFGGVKGKWRWFVWGFVLISSWDASLSGRFFKGSFAPILTRYDGFWETTGMSMVLSSWIISPL